MNRIKLQRSLLLVAVCFSNIETEAANSGKTTSKSAEQKIEMIVLPTSRYSFAAMNYPKSTQWTGLYLSGNTAKLERTTVRSKPTKVNSYDEGKVAAQELTITGRKSIPLCLLRGLPQLKPGNISRFYPLGRNKPTATGPRSGFEIKIDAHRGNRYSLKASEKDNFISYWLKKGNKQQLLQKFEIDPVAGKDGMACRDQIILWAGDLDMDGKADFLTAFNTRTGEGISTQLYLSSKAKADEIVGLAAEFNYWPPDNPGC